MKKSNKNKKDIPSRALATPEQWAAIQAYGLSLEALASKGRATLGQADSNSGQRFPNVMIICSRI